MLFSTTKIKIIPFSVFHSLSCTLALVPWCIGISHRNSILKITKWNEKKLNRFSLCQLFIWTVIRLALSPSIVNHNNGTHTVIAYDLAYCSNGSYVADDRQRRCLRWKGRTHKTVSLEWHVIFGLVCKWTAMLFNSFNVCILITNAVNVLCIAKGKIILSSRFRFAPKRRKM